MSRFSKNLGESGFTLSEVLIATAVFAIVAVGITGTIALFLKYSQQARDKIQAQNLSVQKIETIRNMPYDSVATQAGAIYPPGTLPDEEDITVDNRLFKVYTLISYVDDPFDGNAAGSVVGKPQDLYPYDYKKITITVRDQGGSFLTETTTNMAGKAAETASNTGILSLRVQDSGGQPVAGALVHLTNPNPAPPVNINTFTDESGLVLIPLLPPSSNNGYHVTVSLSGYSSDGTNPATSPNNLYPINPDFNILAQQITSQTFQIDTVASLQLTLKDTSGALLGSKTLSITGDKLTYNAPPSPIYKVNQSVTTDVNGLVTLNNLEWDSYTIAPPSGYYVVSTSPYQKVSVGPGKAVDVTMVVSNDSSYPRVSDVTPIVGVNNSTVDVVITGANLPTGSSFKLVLAGHSDVVATNLVSDNSDTQLSGTFDLTGVVAGTWDLVISDPDGNLVTQVGGFTVNNP